MPPIASRPIIKDYGIPKTKKGMLPWSHVVERLQKSQNYWISTATMDGKPHAVPVWGVLVDETLYFGGAPHVRWARNLVASRQVCVHLDSSDDVVILEGTVELINDASHPMMPRIEAAYEAKYKMRHGIPIWMLRPTVAFAWHNSLQTATRWRFDP